MPKTKCSVPGCTDTWTLRQRFPHPISDPKHRFFDWLRALKCPKLYAMDPMRVYNTKTICKRHFTKDCFVGVPTRQKLLYTAIPTEYLPDSEDCSPSSIDLPLNENICDINSPLSLTQDISFGVQGCIPSTSSLDLPLKENMCDINSYSNLTHNASFAVQDAVDYIDGPTRIDLTFNGNMCDINSHSNLTQVVSCVAQGDGKLKKRAVPSIHRPQDLLSKSSSHPNSISHDKELQKSLDEAAILDIPSTDSEESIENGEDCNVEDLVILENIKKELCRVCGNKDQDLRPIFEDSDPVNLHSVPLVKMLEIYLPLQIRSDDQFPLNICSKCSSTLNEWHELYVTCVAADKVFRNTFCKNTFQDSSDDSPISRFQEIPTDGESNSDPFTTEDHDYVKTKLDVQERKNNIFSDSVINKQSNVQVIEEHVLYENTVNYKQTDLEKCHQESTPCGRNANKSKIQECMNIVFAEWNGCKLTINESQEESRYNWEISKLHSEKYECKYCFESFAEKDHRTAHYKLCQETPTICELCGKIVPRRKHLRKHKYAKHSKKIFCDKCGKWVAPHTLYSHMKSVHTERGYCDLCCSILRSKLAYVLHMKKHASGKLKSTFSLNTIFQEGKQVYVCPVCSETFDDKVSIILHLNKPSPIKCPTCHLKLNNEKRFVLHTCKQWSCQYCSQSFYNRVYWKEHERIHTGEKPYKCHICNISFRKVNHKTVHMIRHRASTFECKYCAKKFKVASKLRIHQLVHEGVRFPCPECDMKFTLKSNLKRHVKKHTVN